MKRRTTPVTGVALRIDVAPFVFWGGWVNKGEKKKARGETPLEKLTQIRTTGKKKSWCLEGQTKQSTQKIEKERERERERERDVKTEKKKGLWKLFSWQKVSWEVREGVGKKEEEGMNILRSKLSQGGARRVRESKEEKKQAARVATAQIVDLQKGEFLRVHEQPGCVEACHCVHPPSPSWRSAPSAYWGNHLKKRKHKYGNTGAGFLTMFEHLQLLQFYFQSPPPFLFGLRWAKCKSKLLE